MVQRETKVFLVSQEHLEDLKFLVEEDQQQLWDLKVNKVSQAYLVILDFRDILE